MLGSARASLGKYSVWIKRLMCALAAMPIWRHEPDGSLKCIHEGYMNVRAVPYDVPILGYRNDTVNTLRLWKAEYTREDVSRQLLYGDVRHAVRYKDSIQMISRYLYPEDSTWEGRKLRLMQEYFFVSAGVQSIVRYYKKKYGPIKDFAKYIAMHINDTHPALVIPELMRILMDEEKLTWEEAWEDYGADGGLHQSYCYAGSYGALAQQYV
jgi:starch phosphorylase